MSEQETIARLKELVKAAYFEAYYEAYDYVGWKATAERLWEQSKAKQAMEQA